MGGRKGALSFDFAKYGPTAFGRSLTLFEVAGADKIFHLATATIKSGKVEVEREQVAAPVAVRYGCWEFVVGDIRNNDSLPTLSERTIGISSPENLPVSLLYSAKSESAF